MRQSSFKIL